MLVGVVGSVLSLACFLYDQRLIKPVTQLSRPESGEGDREVRMEAELQGKKYPLEITLLEIPYGDEEAEACLREAYDGLEKIFLKDNKDLHNIMTDVFMPPLFPGTEVEIRWYLDSWDYIGPDGTVKNEILEETETVRIQAVLRLQDTERTWERTIEIRPLENPDTAQKLKILQYQLLSRQEELAGREVALPDSIQNEPVIWYRASESRGFWMLGLTVLALCGMTVGRKKDNERLQKERERSMELDYPDIVSRLSLYMAAGVSTRKAWERIVESYERKNGEKKKQRAAYEEMRTTLHEMQSGIPEAMAYERFGTRCRIPSYLKLGTLLSQNLRKGTRNLSGLLGEESREAFKERKALARKLGEECESKLLLPMILMLMTVLIMVMYPAVVSFQI